MLDVQLSIVVPTFNRRAVVVRTLEKLFIQDFPADQYEIVVVVDGSTDGTAAAVRELRPPCALSIVEQPNAGLAAARNAGLRQARGEFVLFLDDDIRATPELARAHVTAHRSQPGAVLVIGAVFLSDDSPRTIAADCFDQEIGAFYLAHRQNPARPFPPRSWVFMNTSVRRDLALRAGGFDPEFRMQREDQDFGFRLGLPVWYEPRAIGYEFYDKNGWDLVRDARNFARGDVLLLQLHPELREGSQVERQRHQPVWKRCAREVALRLPLVDAMLAAVWSMGRQAGSSRLTRRIAMRALQVHRGIVWTRAVRSWEKRLPREANGRAQASPSLLGTAASAPRMMKGQE